MSSKNMNLNFIERYDFEFHPKIRFWISSKDMILNFIERYDFEFYWKYDFNSIKIYNLQFYIKNKFKIYPKLMSSLSLANKNKTTSVLFFLTAKYNGVI